MPITSEHQALIITNALMEIRPAWNRGKILALLQENRANEHPFGMILQACVTLANNPTKQTPALLFADGPHWPAPESPGNAPRPPAEPCEDHPEESRHACRCCRADVLAGLRPQDAIGVHHHIDMT